MNCHCDEGEQYVCIPCKNGVSYVALDRKIEELEEKLDSHKKIKIQRKHLKTVAKFIYNPVLHGEWADLIIAMEATFEVTEERIQSRKYKTRRNWSSPPPIPAEAKAIINYERVEDARNFGKYRIRVHRSTPNMKTLCGSNGWDLVTTLDDSFVTCQNCLAPKNQGKLRNEQTQKEDDKVRDHNPSKQLPIAPHFLNSSSSEI